MLAAWFVDPMLAAGSTPRIFIEEYQVKGARQLTRVEIESAVYPYLGPSRTQDDVEKARAALEKAYQGKGYQTVSVQIPAQPWQDGPIILEVTEAPVGRLRVHGARYFLPSQIRAIAPSIAEGKVMNFNDVNRDIVALNQLPDRSVTPALRQGVTPGTVDIDLDVKDSFPLHGSLELNNRYSANTDHLRVDGALSYGNLWQLGHSIGGSFQLSPENVNQVQVYSGYYLARFAELNWLSLMLQGSDQKSQVSTLGNLAVGGGGDVIGLQSIIVLPGGKDFSQTLSLGLDYKSNNQNVGPGGQSNTTQTAYHYFPLSATYSATWMTTNQQTELNIGPAFSFRGVGSSESSFEKSRYKCDGSYLDLRGDLSHTHELPHGFQAYAKIQGQVASLPLVSGEQYGGGGLGTVRGYLEGEVFGDDAIFGRAELRSPLLVKGLGKNAPDWRVYLFAEGGRLWLLDPLPQQQSRFDLASVGVGSEAHLMNHYHGSLDLGVPLINQSPTSALDLVLTFRLWVDL
ncbi:MAG: ShlB/FhaC/HecB family hemolysin secretion/activation protein [Verrucomicrobiota bacterium]